MAFQPVREWPERYRRRLACPTTPPSPSRTGHRPLTSPSSLHRALIKPLLLGLVAVLLALGFAHLGIEVGEGDSLGFDLFFARSAQALRVAHPWLADVLRDWSGLGSTSVLALFAVNTTGYLALNAAWATAAVVGSWTLAGTLLVNTFKDAFGRSRPGVALTDLVTVGPSFPSGHAGMSAIIFLTAGTLLASTRPRRPERAYILLVSALLAMLVGVSRVGLGVHWATDVLGGWAFGVAWAIAGLLLSQLLASRGTARGRLA